MTELGTTRLDYEGAGRRDQSVILTGAASAAFRARADIHEMAGCRSGEGSWARRRREDARPGSAWNISPNTRKALIRARSNGWALWRAALSPLARFCAVGLREGRPVPAFWRRAMGRVNSTLVLAGNGSGGPKGEGRLRSITPDHCRRRGDGQRWAFFLTQVVPVRRPARKRRSGWAEQDDRPRTILLQRWWQASSGGCMKARMGMENWRRPATTSKTKARATISPTATPREAGFQGIFSGPAKPVAGIKQN